MLEPIYVIFKFADFKNSVFYFPFQELCIKWSLVKQTRKKDSVYHSAWKKGSKNESTPTVQN